MPPYLSLDLLARALPCTRCKLMHAARLPCMKLCNSGSKHNPSTPATSYLADVSKKNLSGAFILGGWRWKGVGLLPSLFTL
eukprot:scaffold194838_cov30-Tisochrysis_lutea.AAC.1